jgi:hypothetical protein
MPPPSAFGLAGEDTLAMIWRLLHLDGRDVLPLDAHFVAAGGDKGHAPAIAKAMQIARTSGISADWTSASEEATAALEINATSRGAQVASFGAYLSDVAGAITVRPFLTPDLFEAVAGTWLNLAEPWGHVEDRMPALLARIDALTERDAEALASQPATPDTFHIYWEGHARDLEFMYNSAVLTGRWRAWRAAARATSKADLGFRADDYSNAWSQTAEISGMTASALAFESLLGPDRMAEYARPWRSAIGDF